MSFTRLIRFLDKNGDERFGNVQSDISPSELVGQTVQLVSGSIEKGFKLNDIEIQVSKVSR